MSTASGSFKLTALMDGTTLSGHIRIDGLPLAQRFTGSGDNITAYPDFSAIPENSRPTLVPIIRRLDTGAIMEPGVYGWFYNGVEIIFGEDRLSTNPGFEGTFKLLDENAIVISSQTYHLPCLRVMDNLVKTGNLDNDRISFSGSVEINGNQLQIKELSVGVEIADSQASMYSLVISSDNALAITDDYPEITLEATLYKDANALTTGYTFKWFNATSTDVEITGSGNTVTIDAGEVNGLALIRCDAYEGATKIASAFVQVEDISDPYMVTIGATGIQGEQIRTGETAVLTPKLVRRSGEAADNIPVTWTFNTNDNEGDDFQLTGQSSATVTGVDSISISYSDVLRANGGIITIVTGEFSI